MLDEEVAREGKGNCLVVKGGGPSEDEGGGGSESEGKGKGDGSRERRVSNDVWEMEETSNILGQERRAQVSTSSINNNSPLVRSS